MIQGRDIDRHPADGLEAEIGVYRKVSNVLAAQAPTPGVVDTPEGQMAYEAGDYIVTDNPPTHAWPVKREVFERTYVVDEPFRPDYTMADVSQAKLRATILQRWKRTTFGEYVKVDVEQVRVVAYVVIPPEDLVPERAEVRAVVIGESTGEYRDVSLNLLVERPD